MEDNSLLAECAAYTPPLLCFACEHFRPDRARNAPSTRFGECRRLSPSAIVIDGEVKATWPQVSELDWCGDGRMKRLG